MLPLTAEWVEKAEEDLQVVKRELRARVNPAYGAACFHAQQCVEKYLKALLTESGGAFPLTHNLVALMHLVSASDPTWALLHPDLVVLTLYSVAIRYPGATANRTTAKDAMKICREVRRRARTNVGVATRTLIPEQSSMAYRCQGRDSAARTWAAWLPTDSIRQHDATFPNPLARISRAERRAPAGDPPNPPPAKGTQYRSIDRKMWT